MPEKQFYLSDAERGNLFEYITSINGLFIADKTRKIPDFEYIKSKNEFLYTIEHKCVSFFITSSDFTTQSLLCEQNSYLSEPSFSVSQRYGGPYIAMLFYRGFSKDDEIKYKRSDIFHYPKYINLNNYYEEIPASAELKKYFKQIIDYLKSRCYTINIGKNKYLVSKDIDKDLIN